MIVARRTGFKSRLANKSPTAATKITPSTMGKLFVAILLITVFEGAIRKWVTPALTNPMVLLRDGLALYGLFWALKTGKMHGGQNGAQALWLWTALVVLWGLFQLMVNQSSPLVYLVGLRFWLLYLWFAYAAAVSMTQDDFRYITKTLFWLVLVMAPLAVLQSSLPPSAFLNKQVDGDEETVFRLTADIVRTTGTFSFTLGYTTLIAIFTPFVLSLLSPGAKLWGKSWVPKAIFFALAVATMVSGSRSALIMFGAMFLIYMYIVVRYTKSSAASKKSTKANSVAMLVGVVLILAAVPYLFYRSVEATKERFETAAEVEDSTDRVTSIFFGEPRIYKDISLIGAGVGSGNNFSAVLTTGERTFLLAETEAARTILEGGILGFVFIGIKLLIIFIGFRRSLTIARRTGNSLPLLLWVTLAVALLTWSIIGQLTVNALGYLLLGLGIASLRLGVDPTMGKLR